MVIDCVEFPATGWTVREFLEVAYKGKLKYLALIHLKMGATVVGDIMELDQASGRVIMNSLQLDLPSELIVGPLLPPGRQMIRIRAIEGIGIIGR